MQGATPMDQKILPENTDQIFVMSQNISDTLKEDLAWATYVLLRNTNSISVVFSTITFHGIWYSGAPFLFVALAICLLLVIFS